MTNASVDRFERARASLEGLSVGDAFGETFFVNPDVVEGLIAERALASRTWHYTDDTLMALSVVSVLRRHGRVQQDELARGWNPASRCPPGPSRRPPPPGEDIAAAPGLSCRRVREAFATWPRRAPDARTQGGQKMKNLCMAVALALCVAQGARGAAPAEERRPSLKLTAELVGRRWCAGERMHILQLSVRLRYQNDGGQKLIVYRGKNFFYQTRIRGGAGAEQYEVVVLNSRFNDAQAEALGGRSPGGAFVTLPPGGVYETTVVIGVGVAPFGAGRGANAIRPGEHTLQVVASTWYESRKLGEELRARWRGAGLLWLDPVATQPLTFNAGQDAPAPDCRWRGEQGRRLSSGPPPFFDLWRILRARA